MCKNKVDDESMEFILRFDCPIKVMSNKSYVLFYIRMKTQLLTFCKKYASLTTT